jgi:hypothetical protein
MMMEVVLESVAANQTKVTLTFTNLPQGISPEDNYEGTKQSLNKLAKYLEDN